MHRNCKLARYVLDWLGEPIINIWLWNHPLWEDKNILLTTIAKATQIAKFMGPSWGVGPILAPRWPHEPCYQAMPAHGLVMEGPGMLVTKAPPVNFSILKKNVFAKIYATSWSHFIIFDIRWATGALIIMKYWRITEQSFSTTHPRRPTSLLMA